MIAALHPVVEGVLITLVIFAIGYILLKSKRFPFA